MFVSEGFLSPGIHECTFDEIRGRFGSFQESDRRPALFQRLAQFIQAIRRQELFEEFIIDGSFVTSKSAPNDIDLVAVLKTGHDFERDLPMSEYAMVSRALLHRRFGFDVLIAESATAMYESYIEYFSRVREMPNLRKGLIRLRL